MKIKLIFCCVAFFLFPLFSSAIIITEVQIEGERADDDYIKIYNSSGEDIDVGGYAIRKRTSTGSESSVRVIPRETTIESGEYFIWASSRNADFPETVNANIVSTQYLSRDNSIAVLNREGDVVDALSWGEPQNAYYLGEQFTENPEKQQKIARAKEEGMYINTKNNSSDFFLYPPPPPPPEIIGFKTEQEEKKERSPFLIALGISLVLGAVFILLKKILENVRTQSF